MIQPADFLHFCVLCTLAFSKKMAQDEKLSVFKAFMSRWIFGHGGLLWSSVGAYHHHTSSQILVSITITSGSSKIAQERKFPKLFLKSGSRRMLLKPPELIQMLVSFTVYAILTECFCNSDFLGFPILEHILRQCKETVFDYSENHSPWGSDCNKEVFRLGAAWGFAL